MKYISSINNESIDTDIHIANMKNAHQMLLHIKHDFVEHGFIEDDLLLFIFSHILNMLNSIINKLETTDQDRLQAKHQAEMKKQFHQQIRM